VLDVPQMRAKTQSVLKKHSAVKPLPLCLQCHDNNLKAVVSALSTKTCDVRSKTDVKLLQFSVGVLNVNVHTLKIQAMLKILDLSKPSTNSSRQRE